MGTSSIASTARSVRAGSVLFAALFGAACLQPAMVESSVVADAVLLKQSSVYPSGDSSQLAQLDTGDCTQDAETLDLGDKAASPSEIIDFFKSGDCPKTRSIKKKTDLVATSKKLSMQINFEFNSARLSATGKQALEPLAAALAATELRDKRFLIEGHTDAKGRPAYNLLLSKRRAQSVKRYLVRQFGLNPTRFRISGKGASELLVPGEPYASGNRRVVIALSP